MCSQPPKDVDDRWILREIKDSLALIDPATHALTFTGGETLSDWKDFIDVLEECRDRLPGTVDPGADQRPGVRRLARLWMPGKISGTRA